MKKTDLIGAMAAESGLSKADSQKALKAFMSVVTEAMKREEKVTLMGFGTFYVLSKEARYGVNPTTKDRILIPARKVVKFRPGEPLDLNK